jgi:hypothetical protein
MSPTSLGAWRADERSLVWLSDGAHVTAVAGDDDTGAPQDKRLLILEPEFARVIKVLAREGNTLSPVV